MNARQPQGSFGANGTWRELSEFCNAKQVFQRTDIEQFAMWWAEGAWRVGNRKRVGETVCFLRVESDASRPEFIDPSVTWEVTDGQRAFASQSFTPDAAVRLLLTAPGQRLVDEEKNARRQARAEAFLKKVRSPALLPYALAYDVPWAQPMNDPFAAHGPGALWGT